MNRILPLLVFTGLLAAAVEPGPLTPDPIPAVVRAAADKVAEQHQVEDFTLIKHQGVTLYQAKLVEAASGKPVLATFTVEGELVGVAPIPPHGDDRVPVVPTPAPLEVAPKRVDGRDADPATRRGRDPADHS